MPQATLTIEQVQARRRLTRALSDLLRDELKAYLTTLAPLFRPRLVLGEYLQGSEKESVRGAEQAYKDLHALYDTVARSKPYTLTRELTHPLTVSNVALQLHPVEYLHVTEDGADRRTVRVRQPLAWNVTYYGHGPSALPELLATRSRSSDELYNWMVHQLVLHRVVLNQPGVVDILGKLHFAIESVTEETSGAMPVLRITSPLATLRPPDAVIIQSVELSGMDAFEEVVDVDDILRISDPLRDRLLATARDHGELRA